MFRNGEVLVLREATSSPALGKREASDELEDLGAQKEPGAKRPKAAKFPAPPARKSTPRAGVASATLNLRSTSSAGTTVTSIDTAAPAGVWAATLQDMIKQRTEIVQKKHEAFDDRYREVKQWKKSWEEEGVRIRKAEEELEREKGVMEDEEKFLRGVEGVVGMGSAN